MNTFQSESSQSKYSTYTRKVCSKTVTDNCAVMIGETVQDIQYIHQHNGECIAGLSFGLCDRTHILKAEHDFDAVPAVLGRRQG